MWFTKLSSTGFDWVNWLDYLWNVWCTISIYLPDVANCWKRSLKFLISNFIFNERNQEVFGKNALSVHLICTRVSMRFDFKVDQVTFRMHQWISFNLNFYHSHITTFPDYMAFKFITMYLYSDVQIDFWSPSGECSWSSWYNPYCSRRWILWN